MICNPPVTDTDIDIVTVWTERLHEALKDAGYLDSSTEKEEGYDNPSVMCCYRNGDINIIAVPDSKQFFLWLTYTKLASHLNLREKAQRVALAQFITEGAIRGTDINV